MKQYFQGFNSRDYVIFLGLPLSGKTLAMDLIKKLSIRLSEIDPKKHTKINTLKIYPKSFDASYIFSDAQKATKIQFYSIFLIILDVYLLHAIKQLYDMDENRYDSTTSKNIPGLYPVELIKPQEKIFKKILNFDGQIDPLWIDNLNVIFNEQKQLCLPNGDSINLNEYKFVFETQNLNFCSPSFITKVSIFHFSQKYLNWENLFYNWLNLNPKTNANFELKNYIRGLFENYFPKVFDFIQANKVQSYDFEENFVLVNLINLFESVLPQYDFEDKKIGKRSSNLIPKIELIKKSSLSIFIFSSAWIMNFFTDFILKGKIEKQISDTFKADDLKGPIFEYYIDENTNDYAMWKENLETLYPDQPKFLFNSVFVPNEENIAYYWIVEKYLSNNKPILYIGKPCTGKSLLINNLLNRLNGNDYWVLKYLINYSSNSKKLEQYLNPNLIYIRKDLRGDKYDRNFLVFVDDVNLQKSDQYHSKNCFEFIRSIINEKGFFDTFQGKMKNLNKFNFICSGNMLSYSKNENTDRFVHSFNIVLQNVFSDEILHGIYKPILENHIKNFITNNTFSIISSQFTQVTFNINENLNREMKPSHSKMQYKFNLRDVVRIFEGMMMANYNKDIDYQVYLMKIWYYETKRVYSDRLSNEEDKKILDEIISKQYRNTFKRALDSDESYLFSPNIPDKLDYHFYPKQEEIFEPIKKCLEEYYKDKKHKHLILSYDTLLYIVKILRVLIFKKGNLILIGPSLSGKQSLIQFACSTINKTFQEFEDSLLTKIEKIEKNLFDNKLNFFNKFVKKLLLDALLNDDKESVFYFGNKLTENVK